ncbi:MAG: amidohydrolase family protein [Thermoanaerobaculia bacterium]|nr:amidohydrolase family protein [Thermoanaerobaculia bacterium]
MHRSLLAVALFLAATVAAAQQRPQAFVGATIIPIAGDPIENGTLVIAKGKVVAIGAQVAIPQDAERHDVSGKVIMPGLVDTHSHVGKVSGADSSGPIQPDVRALDSIDARDASIQRAQAGGITTVNIMPGSGFLLSGQTLYVKLRDGRTIDDRAIRNEDGSYAGGMKMATGTNSMKDAPFPETRSKSAALVREQFVKAQEYRKKVREAKTPADRPSRDLAMDGLVEVLDGRRVVHYHSHRHDDLVTAMRLAKEFGFRLVLQHATESGKVADEIAKAGIPCSIIFVDSPGGKLETMDLTWRYGAILEKAGVLVAVHTDDPITDSRWLLRSAGLGVRAGLTRNTALAALTINGAKMLGLERRVGSLEPGKDADFIVLSGDPLSVYTHVLETWVDGTRVFDRSDPADRLRATGGFGAGNDRTLHSEIVAEGAN